MSTPTIANIPTAYKAGKIYSQLPVDGSADFDVTRNSTATRVNQNGLIEEVGVDVPRLDYTDGGCPVWLLEPQSTNLVTFSEDFSQTNWTKERCNITNGFASPDGSTNAYKMTATDDDARLQGYNTSAGVVHTQSWYVKSANGSDVSGQIDFSGADAVTFVANNDWQRVSSTQSTTGVRVTRIRIINNGDELLVFGAQLEQQASATSYIPTSGSTVTRAADSVSKSGLEDYINSSEGVLYFEGSALSDDGTNRYLSLHDGTSNNYIYFRYVSTSNQYLFRTQVSGVIVNTLAGSLLDTTENHKFAFKFKSGDYSMWVDGVEVSTDSSLTIFPPNTLSNLEFSFPTDGGDGFASKVKDLRVYDKALTDTELQQLTQ